MAKDPHKVAEQKATDADRKPVEGQSAADPTNHTPSSGNGTVGAAGSSGTISNDAATSPATGNGDASHQSPNPTQTPTNGHGTANAGDPTSMALAEGVRARRAFMPKQLLPDRDWINMNIVAKGAGTQGVIGRFWGVATKTYRKAGTLPNGQPSETICMEGDFQTESYVTGELSRYTSAYLPMAYAGQVEAVLLADRTITVIEVDCDIGLEATGKPIPYEWVVVAYREGAEMAVLKRLRASRQRPTVLVLTAAEKAAGKSLASLPTRQLTGPAQ